MPGFNYVAVNCGTFIDKRKILIFNNLSIINDNFVEFYYKRPTD